jgi:ubiquinone/menaquinone biosynthesis C-methylase UbiE
MANPNLWQKKMYDEVFARATIASKAYARIARVEAEFLAQAMGLRKGEKLLDVPCGTGRHARIFAERGLRVTGIDLNPSLIRMAKRASTRKAITYHLGDMSKLGAYRGQFDAVVNLFTSFGYFANERENGAMLREMTRALKPGGRLAIHLIDRDWLLKNFQANTWSEKGNLFTLEARRYDERTKRIEAKTVILDEKTGRGRSYSHESRLYSKPEVVRLLKSVGLTRIEVFGDTDGSLYRKGETSHPIYIAWKRHSAS